MSKSWFTILIVVYFRRLKINHVSHDFILEFSTVTNRYLFGRLKCIDKFLRGSVENPWLENLFLMAGKREGGGLGLWRTVRWNNDFCEVNEKMFFECDEKIWGLPKITDMSWRSFGAGRGGGLWLLSLSDVSSFVGVQCFSWGTYFPVLKTSESILPDDSCFWHIRWPFRLFSSP